MEIYLRPSLIGHGAEVDFKKFAGSGSGVMHVNRSTMTSTGRHTMDIEIQMVMNGEGKDMEMGMVMQQSTELREKR